MKVNLKDVIIFALIGLTFLIAVSTPSDQDLQDLKSEVGSLREIVKENDDYITNISEVVLDHEDTLELIIECNPYCKGY